MNDRYESPLEQLRDGAFTAFRGLLVVGYIAALIYFAVRAIQ